MSWTRRSLLRAGSLAATAVASSSFLAACSGQTRSANGKSSASSSGTALPSYAAGAVILNFSCNWQAPWSTTAQQLNQEFIDANYNSQPANKGYYWKVFPNIQGQGAAQIAASLAGKGYMDVYHDCCSDFAALEKSGLMTPLNSYIQKDNVDMSIFSQRKVDALTLNGEILALPAYDGTVAMMYREDLINKAGQTVPNPDWNWQDAQQIWQSVSTNVSSGKSSTHQYGVCLFSTPWDETLDYLLHGWGTTKMDSTGTVFTGYNKEGIALMTYLQNLATNKIAMGRSNIITQAQGQCVFRMAGNWDLIYAAEELGTAIPWNILPVPKWPSQQATYVNLDAYVLNKATKHPQQAWEFMKWVTTQSAYQEFQMKTTMVAPCITSLWSTWQSIVTQQAPPLQGKNLQYYAEADQQNYAYPEKFFKYHANEAITLMNKWCNEIWAGSESPTTGLQQLAHQINAMEAASVPSGSSSSTSA